MRWPLSSLALAVVLLAAMSWSSVSLANHIASSPCASAGACAGHEFWPRLTLADVRKTSETQGGTLVGRPGRSDELLGWHGSDTLYGGDQSDILWADHIGTDQPTTQVDRLYGGDGNDFIYSGRGKNTIEGGPGNDAIKARYGHGTVDCGPGLDIVYLPKSRRKNWTFVGCEKFEYRSESELGHGLKPLGTSTAAPQPQPPLPGGRGR